MVLSPQVLLVTCCRSNPAAVKESLKKELCRGHTSGPFDRAPYPVLHCSPLGAIQKKDNSHRIILDLSSPRGSSVNEGISSSDYSVRYSSFDDAVTLVTQFTNGCYLAKLDIKHAFHLCPVRPEDWCLLGHYFEAQFFVDTRLPFGSRSSPFLFNTVADLITWILIFVYGVPNILHYLDDFFLCASSFSECHSNMRIVQDAFQELGIPLAPDKVVGPSPALTYLGIEIDADAQIIHLPTEKLQELHRILATWSARKKCTKRELLSLIGSLSFASKVVKPGRMFLRRLIELSTTVQNLNHHISLTVESRADLHWWIQFLSQWNGVEFFQSHPVTSDAMLLFTDASGVHGFGAVYGCHWFACTWPTAMLPYHINFKELFAIVAAVFTWGNRWTNKQIIINTDNLTLTNIWKTGSSRDKDVMRLVRALFLFSARHNINILMEHIAGHNNYLADSLSRLQVDKFKHHCPEADHQPTSISPTIWELY